MRIDTSKNIRLGLFVAIGGTLFILAMYLIGDKQSLFSSTFHISANFRQVNGLTTGNNIRYQGITVGSIESVHIVDDSTIRVSMTIENDVKKFIKKNTMASVGSDGVMGNKIINLNILNIDGPSIEDGDVIQGTTPTGTDEMMRTLNHSNEDVAVIMNNLKIITQKVNSPNTLWSILMDTVVANNVKNAIVNIKLTTNRTATLTGDLSRMIKDVNDGKGSIGELLNDTVFAKKLNQTMSNIKLLSDSLSYISSDLRSVTKKIRNGEGAIGTILMDSIFLNNLNASMVNIKNGSKGLDDNMQALKHSIFLRKYYKKQENEAKKLSSTD